MPLADNGHQVRLVGTHLDGDIIEEIHESRVHPRLKSRLRDAVTPYTYDRLGEALEDADLVVLGVNSLGIEWAGQMLADKLPPDVPLLFLTKGLAGHDGALELLPHRLRRELPPALQRTRQARCRRRPFHRRRTGGQPPHLCGRHRQRRGA